MKKVKCLLIWSSFDKFTQGIKAIKKRRRRENNLDVDQCVDPWWVFNRRMSEIESLGLQKFKQELPWAFTVSLLPHLHYCQLWLLFVLQLQYKSRKRRRSNINSRTQETDKQNKPKKLKAKKERDQEKSVAFNIKQQRAISLELNCIEKKERKHSVCKQWPCNLHREHLEMQFDYGGNSPR